MESAPTPVVERAALFLLLPPPRSSDLCSIYALRTLHFPSPPSPAHLFPVSLQLQPPCPPGEENTEGLCLPAGGVGALARSIPAAGCLPSVQGNRPAGLPQLPRSAEPGPVEGKGKDGVMAKEEGW